MTRIRLRFVTRRVAAWLIATLLGVLLHGSNAHGSTEPGVGRFASAVVNSSGVPEFTPSKEPPRRWYRCTLGGHPCGRMIEVEETLDTGGTRSSIDLELRFRRGEVETSTRIRTWIDHTADGVMEAMGIRQELGGEPVSTTWSFRGDDVIERRSQGGRTVESRRPRPTGDWHAPDEAMAIARRRARTDEGGSTRLLVLDPARGIEPAMVEFRRTGIRMMQGLDGEIEATRWEVTDSDGSVAVEFFDPEGVLISSEVSMGAGLGVLRIERATEADARIALQGDVELMEAGVVEPVFIGPKRRLDRGGRAVYRIKARGEDDIAPSFPDAGAQRVRADDASDTILIEIETGRSSPVEDDFDPSRYLEATATLDAADPVLKAFAERHDRAGRPGRERVRALRSAVYRHIDRKDLGTAFGTASETVRSRRGDCTEHAVLLAAALRSVGIPSRLANGLVWIPRPGRPGGAFLWHMWTQAAVDGRWIDLDPTLGGANVFHPGHIAVSFADGGAGDLEIGGRAMLDVFGAIDIEVLKPGASMVDESAEPSSDTRKDPSDD